MKPEVKLRIRVLYNEASSNTRKQQENNNHRYQELLRSLALIVGNTDTNCLHLRVIVKSVRTQLSTHAGLFEATEWHLVVKGIVVVNPHRTIFPMFTLAEWPKNWWWESCIPGFDGTRHAECSVDIPGVNGGGQSYIIIQFQESLESQKG